MSTRTEEETCKFCGKTRIYNVYIHGDDDEDGRAYGIYETKDDDGCDCIFGKMLHNKEKVTIKPMCMNCKYNVCLKCTNKEMLEEMSKTFNVRQLGIKDKTYCCKHYKMKEDIFDELIHI